MVEGLAPGAAPSPSERDHKTTQVAAITTTDSAVEEACRAGVRKARTCGACRVRASSWPFGAAGAEEFKSAGLPWSYGCLAAARIEARPVNDPRAVLEGRVGRGEGASPVREKKKNNKNKQNEKKRKKR